MPREIRKRGKKHKKSQHQALPQDQGHAPADHPPNDSSQPSWIVPVPATAEGANPEAPFGYVGPDIKAYFRTVDEQIQFWQENETQSEDEVAGLDPNESKRVFFVAALGEMSGKEKQLATDPDCSVVLERMAYSMDDFVLRVFMDRLSGSFEALFKHRFASHVCQTLLSVATDTISREVEGIFPDVPPLVDNGELRTVTQLALDICEEIVPSFNLFVMDPFASHVLRSLLLLLCPNILPEDARKSLRSKKSMSWKAKRGHMRSVFAQEKGKEDHVPSGSVPTSFCDAANRFLRILRDGLSANEVRALVAHKVGAPVLQLLLDIEADHGSAGSSDSLMDRVLVGMIKAYNDNPMTSIQPSDYLITLLRNPTSSHSLETLLSRCPEQVFNLFWSTYFEDDLARLAIHPIANFVLAKAIERQDGKQLDDTLKGLKSSWTKLIRKTGVLRAVIDRSRTLGTHQKDVSEAVLAAVELGLPDDRNHLVPCMLLLKTLEEYRALSEPGGSSTEEYQKKRGGDARADKEREPKIQGALILQSLMKLDEPHCTIVVDSINSLSVENLIRVAHNATSSRVLDNLFESPTVSFKAKRRFVMSLIGHYHSLVDDRIGSRVADRCWAFADLYLKEKIARSLVPFEQFLAASFYGKFFARNLNLYLLQRRPEDWKAFQLKAKANSTKPVPQSSTLLLVQQPSTPVAQTRQPKSWKKREAFEDEIDTVFEATLRNKIKRAAVDRVSTRAAQRSTNQQTSEVLCAIREAPGSERSGRKKRRKVD